MGGMPQMGMAPQQGGMPQMGMAPQQGGMPQMGMPPQQMGGFGQQQPMGNPFAQRQPPAPQMGSQAPQQMAYSVPYPTQPGGMI